MKKLIVIAALFCGLLIGLVAAAQQPELSLEITGVNTTGFPEVLIAANVYDALGQPVPALDSENFTLAGDLAGDCPISEVENISDDNLAFSTVLVIDVSDSMAGTPLELAKAAARRYVESLRPGDSVALVAFASQVEQVLGYTDDRDAVLAAIDGLQISGRTALYQASYEGIQTGAQSPHPRRAMILLSDGSEYGGLSTVTPEEVIAAARVNGVPVYTIGLGYGADRSFLETISVATNAAYYESPTPDELASIYEGLGLRLTSQYVITLNCDLPADGAEYPLILNVQSGDASASAQTTLRAPVPVPVINVTLPDTPIAAPTLITADVLADDALQSVVFTIDGQIAGEFTQPPFSIEINPYDFTPGTHRLEVVATDEDGESGSYQADFEVADLPVQVIVAGLEDGQSLSADTTLEFSFNSQTPVNHVAVMLDGVELAHLVQEPWTLTLRPLRYAPDEHTLSIAADTADGQHGERTLIFSFSNAPYQTATALAPTATQTPSPTFTLTPTPNLTGTANAMALTTVPLTTTAEALFAAMTGTMQAYTEATGTAVMNASATSAAALQATIAAATQGANDLIATAGAQAQATNFVATQNTGSTAQAVGTQQAQQNQTAAVQASATSASIALAATDSAVSTAQMATLEAQALATATFEAAASLEAGEQTAAAATLSANLLITATENARATSNAEARQLMQNATRDALATSNAEARLIAQQTSAARATNRVESTATAESRATATSVARETALFISNTTGTALANSIATTTAQAQATATRVALETAVAQQQQTMDAGSTATAQAQATATAAAQIAGTSTAQALALTATAVSEQTLNARSTVAAIGQGTATAEAQQTLDTRLAAIGTTTAESTPEVTEAAAQPTAATSPTIPPTLVPIEAEPQAADASSGGLLIALVVILLLAILVAIVVYARRRNRTLPKR